jgi:hypothetical protein
MERFSPITQQPDGNQPVAATSHSYDITSHIPVTGTIEGCLHPGSKHSICIVCERRAKVQKMPHVCLSYIYLHRNSGILRLTAITA